MRDSTGRVAIARTGFHILALLALSQVANAAPATYVAVRPDANATRLPPIELPAGEGAVATGWRTPDAIGLGPSEPACGKKNAVHYLNDAIRRMTGKELPVVSRADLSHGIVLTTLAEATPDIRRDAGVQEALRNSGADEDNANEAFFIRTEANRTLVVANTDSGLCDAVVELVDSVGYEVLGMGPDWIHVPDFHGRSLAFSMERAGRPGIYIRRLKPTTGQQKGVGTLVGALPDPEDEPVNASFERWSVGARIAGTSTPLYPGHAMQAYHRAVLERMIATRSTAGFLLPTRLGPDAARPPASSENKSQLWIDTDASRHVSDAADPQGAVFHFNGTAWVPLGAAAGELKLDLSAPLVRQIVWSDLKEKSESFFALHRSDANPGVFVFATDPEDGMFPEQHPSSPDWYPQYMASIGKPLGRNYALNGYKGLRQPAETWDSTSYSDVDFAFNNWLLSEYDRWLGTLPPAQQVVGNGISKKSLIRLSLYSYNFHDVPPDFNLDPRIRVMIAGFPKNRGKGKWAAFRTQTDIAGAFRILLPRNPAGEYLIPSQAYYHDFGLSNIGGSLLASSIQKQIRTEYDAGVRAFSMETDFNFGRLGLEYYLYAKMMWNPLTSASELDALRDRWLQRSFGSGWREMKQYFDFMAPENYPGNSPNNWAKAVRLIAAADEKVDPTREPAAKRRIDDEKQYWYYYYLVASGQVGADSTALKEFAWKGQMSYMTAMHMLVRRHFSTTDVRKAAGQQFSLGRAHFTAAETEGWWRKVLGFWKVTPTADFSRQVLADGKLAKDIDLNDLVAVAEFQGNPVDSPFYYNSALQKNPTVLEVATRAGEEVGFKLFWPYKPDDIHYTGMRVSYSMEEWDPVARRWHTRVGTDAASQQSRAVKIRNGATVQLVEVRYKTPAAGTYRIQVGNGGLLASLSALNYEPTTGKYIDDDRLARGFTFSATQDGLTQSPTYFYIPKGTKSLDLEPRGPVQGSEKLTLNRGLPAARLVPTRSLDVDRTRTSTVRLSPGEDGSIAALASESLYFPYLYSVPMLWAKSPSVLLVPRAVAKADGLTILP